MLTAGREIHSPLSLFFYFQFAGSISHRNREVNTSTYKCSGKSTLKDCSLRAEMVHPDSTDENHIATSSVIGG